jgi:hypothetical protein
MVSSGRNALELVGKGDDLTAAIVSPAFDGEIRGIVSAV